MELRTWCYGRDVGRCDWKEEGEDEGRYSGGPVCVHGGAVLIQICRSADWTAPSLPAPGLGYASKACHSIGLCVTSRVTARSSHLFQIVTLRVVDVKSISILGHPPHHEWPPFSAILPPRW